MKKCLLLISLLTMGLAFGGPAFAKAESSHKTTEHHRAHKGTVQGKLDINTATASQLANLKHIGVKKAAAIVAYRNANGNFKSVDDLTKVKGVSQRIVEVNRGNLRLS